MGTLEFRAEFFNIFNIVNFGLPSNIVQRQRLRDHQQDGRDVAADSVFAESDLLKASPL